MTDKTRRSINAEAIAKMKDGVRIIKFARGRLIVEKDLVAALESGRVAGAGVDVFEGEDAATENELLHLPNVVCTPHLGASTSKARETVGLPVAEQMSDLLGAKAQTQAPSTCHPSRQRKRRV